jgi:medium-chain acyl-[acyl-carrier-protein] hydrolase
MSVRLFCFPYAGGSAAIYRPWSDGLPPSIEVCSIQLPGRGARLLEKPFSRISPLVSALSQALLPLFDKPFAFFGHSMGALIGFELARLLQRKGGPQPLHLFISGAAAPFLPPREIALYKLPEPELIHALHGLNGTPKELLESEELMQLMLPTLRADFAICDTYTYKKGAALRCPITVCGGTRDRKLSRRSDLQAWRSETEASFSLQMFPGDHFFLHTAQPQLLQLLSTQLGQLARHTA